MFKNWVDLPRFDRVLDKVTITAAESGKLTAELTVSEEHANRAGTLHGGITCTVVDCLSTLALTTIDERSDENTLPPAASINLSVSFLRPAKIGETIEISANLLKKGRALAYLSVDIYEKNSGKLVAKASHTKYL
ncbi:acyl-coenzyme A thioesterase 13-like protein [Dinothrombium tinctorium]|nr:acyl-coenzyme A thioesterase 13-like protein [Dinothrombium tinctorium]